MDYRTTTVPAEIRTKLDSLNLIDRFLFNETAEDFEAYRAMIEILTGREISLIPWNETEKELMISPELRAVRLDVIGKDEENLFYQMEMQKKNTQNLPKRSRFYQGLIDVSLLNPGCKNFNALNDLTMILVAPFDVFGYGLYRYTFCGHCEEIPALRLEDGAKRIFINTRGKNAADFSQEFLDFMNYIEHSTDSVAEQTESSKLQLIHNVVRRIRSSEKMGVKFMQWWEEKSYARDEGYEEGYDEGLEKGLEDGLEKGIKKGIEEGIEKGIKKGIEEGEISGAHKQLLTLVQRKLTKGKSVEEIADALEESTEKIAELIKELENC